MKTGLGTSTHTAFIQVRVPRGGGFKNNRAMLTPVTTRATYRWSTGETDASQCCPVINQTTCVCEKERLRRRETAIFSSFQWNLLRSYRKSSQQTIIHNSCFYSVTRKEADDRQKERGTEIKAEVDWVNTGTRSYKDRKLLADEIHTLLSWRETRFEELQKGLEASDALIIQHKLGLTDFNRMK